MALGLPQPSLLDQDNECGTSGQIQHRQSSTFVQQQMVQGINTKNSIMTTCILKPTAMLGEILHQGMDTYCICTGDTLMNKTVVLLGSMCASTHLDHVLRTFRYASTRSISSYLTCFLEKDPPCL